VIVFFLCGLWHGASDVVWGLFHGLFLVIERLAWYFASRRPIVQHVMLAVILVSWPLPIRDSLSGDYCASARSLVERFGIPPGST
jgi:alginate O-acetyltransferase complex protein AlgI